MNLRTYKTIDERKKAIEKLCRVSLPNIGTFSLDGEVASKRNCENMIGVAQIPLGIAGPLLIKNDELRITNYYIPLATTEGALVASVNRGCKAITESGGTDVHVQSFGATRGPVFRIKDNKERILLQEFLHNHFSNIQTVAASTSHHLTLKDYSLKSTGRYAYVRFVFDTKDAMGLNMVTIATDAIVSYITFQTGIACIDLSGNFCVDKKPSWQNILNNRGKVVHAEVILPNKVLTEVLKITAQKMYESWLSKCMLGSIMSGSMGFNAQFANVIAALFIATGQDPAHVVEGSLGITTTEIVRQKDLYVSIYLPDLMVGTVGGGTGLGTQKEALEMLGVAGGPPAGGDGKNAETFAGILGGAVLAGEISLLASLAQGSLAEAHKKLGRGGK